MVAVLLYVNMPMARQIVIGILGTIGSIFARYRPTAGVFTDGTSRPLLRS